MFINKEDLNIVKEDQDWMGDRSHIENLFEVCLERHKVMRNVFIGQVQIAANLFTDGEEKRLEGRAIWCSAKYSSTNNR